MTNTSTNLQNILLHIENGKFDSIESRDAVNDPNFENNTLTQCDLMQCELWACCEHPSCRKFGCAYMQTRRAMGGQS